MSNNVAFSHQMLMDATPYSGMTGFASPLWYILHSAEPLDVGTRLTSEVHIADGPFHLPLWYDETGYVMGIPVCTWLISLCRNA